MPLAIALLAGIIFGAGLTLADMVNPARVLNFLDIAGTWDPTLIFVMAGGLTVTAIGYRLVLRRSAPIWAPRFYMPTKAEIDFPLVAGAALFGVGWGLGGICPGPAITDLVTLRPEVLVFVAAMTVGILGMSAWQRRQ